jgi:hypothetical protein
MSPVSSFNGSAARRRALVAALAGLVVAGCYAPKIGDKLKCNGMYEQGMGDCPDGYHCESDGYCHPGAYVPGSAGAGGHAGAAVGGGGAGGHTSGGAGATAGGSGSGGSPVDAGPDVPPVCINTPIPSCTADTAGKKCDPVCQVGCGCTQKCSVNSAAALTCNPPLASLRPKGLGEGCNPASVGMDAQTDDCQPGLVCMMDACGSRCYRFCRSDADCPLSTCSRNAGGGFKVCDVQSMTCNPVRNNGMPTNCPGAAQGCFIVPNGTDTTLCDCPGAGKTGTQCSFSRDCFPGLVCVDVGGTGTGTCKPACSLAPGATDCGAGTCTAIKNSVKFGYCPN